jgi:hypothetical protein
MRYIASLLEAVPAEIEANTGQELSKVFAELFGLTREMVFFLGSSRKHFGLTSEGLFYLRSYRSHELHQ